MSDKCCIVIILQIVVSIFFFPPEYENDSIETSNTLCGLDESLLTAKRVSRFSPSIRTYRKKHSHLDPGGIQI